MAARSAVGFSEPRTWTWNPIAVRTKERERRGMTMRSQWTAALSAITMLALAPSFASANDDAVQQQLQQMQNRMQQMEDKLQATTDQLDSANERVDEQSQLIEQSGLA
ncbi:MAG: hypothetical protein NTZ61_16995, partial [Proteobacteria bacterium]|nr:hypothetical protein [Pseudomonadota bacterium]